MYIPITSLIVLYRLSRVRKNLKPIPEYTFDRTPVHHLCGLGSNYSPISSSISHKSLIFLVRDLHTSQSGGILLGRVDVGDELTFDDGAFGNWPSLPISVNLADQKVFFVKFLVLQFE